MESTHYSINYVSHLEIQAHTTWMFSRVDKNKQIMWPSR